MSRQPQCTSTRFQYTTLARPKQDTRLVEVCQDPGSPLQLFVIIHEAAIHDAPDGYSDLVYDAISYTWGDTEAEEQIRIQYRTALNKTYIETMVVRKNCADVLRQLAHFAASRFYWIDAICINQEDKKERAAQVTLMGDIFGRARCVLACVGVDYNDSDFLAHTLDSFDKSLATGQSKSEDLTRRTVSHRTVPRITQHNINDDRKSNCLKHTFAWISQTNPADFERFFKALDNLARRPYFWRIWILQELCLADKIRIFCGVNELRLSTLLF